jgi:HEAT repeat protein
MSLRMIRSATVALVLLAAGDVAAQWPTPVAPVAPVRPAKPVSPVEPIAPLAKLSWHDEASLFDATWAAHVTEFSEQVRLPSSFSYDGQDQAIRGPSMQRFPQDPADSLYREARQLLNRGEWRRAATMFARVADHRPASAYAADALYWQSFSLYRIGGTNELRQALAALDSRKEKYPNARSETEATTLATRIRGALASRGDRAAEAALAAEARAGGGSCDSDEIAVRTAAMNALVDSDPEAAQQLVSRILDRKDECSEGLRKNAVTILGRKGDDAAKAKLAQVVRSDPSVEIRGSALGYLARSSGDEVVPTLDAVIRNDAEDERLRRSAVRALGAHESVRAKAAIRALVERSDAPETLRLEALSTFDRGAGYNFAYTTTPTSPRPAAAPAPARAPSVPVPPRGASTPTAQGAAERAAERAMERELEHALAVTATSVVTLDGQQFNMTSERRISPEDATWLRNVYPRLETTRLKSRAVAVLSRSGDEATLTWLMAMVQREEEPADIRATVLSRLGRDLPITSLNRLYDAASNRAVRQQIVSTLGSRKEPEATDKLFEIVRNDTDPQLRRSAMSALTRKNDPRTTKLLMELIDK